jgi:hypothetical protein
MAKKKKALDAIVKFRCPTCGRHESLAADDVTRERQTKPTWAPICPEDQSPLEIVSSSSGRKASAPDLGDSTWPTPESEHQFVETLLVLHGSVANCTATYERYAATAKAAKQELDEAMKEVMSYIDQYKNPAARGPLMDLVDVDLVDDPDGS